MGLAHQKHHNGTPFFVQYRRNLGAWPSSDSEYNVRDAQYLQEKSVRNSIIRSHPSDSVWAPTLDNLKDYIPTFQIYLAKELSCLASG
jgi:hypothetical protein